MKAQAAMEFLLTYGWAIVVLIVMISGLAYLGILDPRDWVPDKCSFSAGIGCGDYVVFDEGSGERINIVLTNNFGNSIVVSRVNITDLGTNAGCDCAGGLCNLGGVWESANSKIMNISCSNSVNSVNLRIRLTYMHIDGEYDRLIEGRIQSKVAR